MCHDFSKLCDLELIIPLISRAPFFLMIISVRRINNEIFLRASNGRFHTAAKDLPRENIREHKLSSSRARIMRQDLISHSAPSLEAARQAPLPSSPCIAITRILSHRTFTAVFCYI